VRFRATLAAAAALALLCCSSLSAMAQTSRMPPIGLLSTGTDAARPLTPQWVAFLDARRALRADEVIP
jgi:hypothetical protein